MSAARPTVPTIADANAAAAPAINYPGPDTDESESASAAPDPSDPAPPRAPSPPAPAWADAFEAAEEKGFRFQSLCGLLTYPSAPDTTAQQFADLFTAHFPLGAVRLRACCVGRELHLDGTPHFHVYFELDRKPDFRSCRIFDLVHPLRADQPLHPNIARIKRGDRQGAYEYARKHADYHEHGIDLFLNSRNFCRRRDDFNAWAHWRELRELKPFKWPLILPTDEELREPPITQRARIILITGPADWGKSHWLEYRFAGTNAYKRPPNAGNYPYDGYTGAPIILIDDPQPVPELHELIAVNNVYKTQTPVYGLTRYRPKYWPLNQARTTVIVINDRSQLPYGDDPRFTTRLWVHADVSVLSPFDVADE